MRDVHVTESEGRTSRHSGRALRAVEISFRCVDGLRNEVTDELNVARDAGGALESDDGVRWLVGSHSHSSVNGGSRRYTAILTEPEVVHAERLEFLGLVLTPSHYDEREAASDNVLMIAARETQTRRLPPRANTR